MNSTVADLVAYLLTLDPTTEVRVVNHCAGTGGYNQGGNACTVPFLPAFTEHSTLPDGTKDLLLGRFNR